MNEQKILFNIVKYSIAILLLYNLAIRVDWNRLTMDLLNLVEG